MGNSSTRSIEKTLETVNSIKRGPETGIKLDVKQYRRDLAARSRQDREREERKYREPKKTETQSQDSTPSYKLCQRCYTGYVFRDCRCDHCGGQ